MNNEPTQDNPLKLKKEVVASLPKFYRLFAEEAQKQGLVVIK